MTKLEHVAAAESNSVEGDVGVKLLQGDDPRQKLADALAQNLYNACGVGVPQDMIQAAATLYELMYISNQDGEDEEPGQEADDDAEKSLGELVAGYPGFRSLLGAFPTKEDRNRKLSLCHY